MSVVEQNMRQMRGRLKSAWGRLRVSTQFPTEPARLLRHKAEALRVRARQWRGAEPAAPLPLDDAALSGPTLWPAAAAENAAPAARGPDITREEGHARTGLNSALRMAGIGVLVFLALPYFLIPFYRFIDPPFSALMARQFLTGTAVRQSWVNIQDMSPALPAAVVISEDAAFCRHWGVDWRAVGDMLEDAENGDGLRGASTIPMQTGKNLFLWNGLGFLRKPLEVPLAYYMSIMWPKRRMLEIYLNIAEWGPGIFGAEAAARHHFGKSAAQLSGREAALLAASLPNPIKRRAGRPSAKTARLAAHIQARVGREGQDAACALSR
jgi:monofunctional biosynthetic peptidoglycan transglycosylase